MAKHNKTKTARAKLANYSETENAALFEINEPRAPWRTFI